MRRGKKWKRKEKKEKNTHIRHLLPIMSSVLLIIKRVIKMSRYHEVLVKTKLVMSKKINMVGY